MQGNLGALWGYQSGINASSVDLDCFVTSVLHIPPHRASHSGTLKLPMKEGDTPEILANATNQHFAHRFLGGSTDQAI